MVADLGRFKPTRGKSSGFVTRRTMPALRPVTEDRMRSPRAVEAEFASPAADRSLLLEYAAFVLDQEARYCQQ